MRAPVAGPSYHYRTKARLGVRLVGDAPLIGFREHLSNRVARMEDCPVLTPRLGCLIEPLKSLVNGLSVRDAVPQIELAAGDEDCALVVRHLRPLSDGDADALRRFAQRFRVALLTQAGGPETATLLAAPAGRTDQLGYAIAAFGLYLNFLPSDFTQVNLALNQRLVADVVQALGPPNGLTADLFCGIGNFALPLARRGHRVLGLEGDAGSIERARANAALNGMSGRCEFAVADLYQAPTLPDRLGAAVVDPPRSGLDGGLLDALSGCTNRLAYVSCNPATFARDARQLVDFGFGLTEAAVYDLFPQTAHIETFGLFERG